MIIIVCTLIYILSVYYVATLRKFFQTRLLSHEPHVLYKYFESDCDGGNEGKIEFSLLRMRPMTEFSREAIVQLCKIPKYDWRVLLDSIKIKSIYQSDSRNVAFEYSLSLDYPFRSIMDLKEYFNQR